MLYYLSLGANIGNREQTLQRALKHIEQQIGHVMRVSAFYYSEPWGFKSPNPFCNLCCAVETMLEPLEVLQSTQSIERELGRTQKSTNGNRENVNYTDRNIDIDIIQAFDQQGNEIKCQISDIQSPIGEALTLPHPLWKQRPFVTIPLAEITDNQ